jgi:hypothetical protein
MSSLLEQASLIVTPNAFKAGKLYSIKGADLDVVRATSATRVNAEGLIESVANNVPRLDYTNGSCPSWSVEPQRTNLLLRSEEFDNASWSKSNVTITANQTNSPDGNLNADLAVFDNTVLEKRVQVLMSLANSTTYTFSCFFKNNNFLSSEIFNVNILNTNSAPGNMNSLIDVNLFDKTVTSPLTTGTSGTGFGATFSSSIEEVNNNSNLVFGRV